MSELRDRLAQMTDDELLSLAPEGAYDGWGVSGAVSVDGTDVFVKRLPLTDIEVARPRSTRNHFRLPTYYSYGVGSAGFGAWREQAAHERMCGRAGFTAQLHHRVLSRTSAPRPLPWNDEEYVAYWNGSRAVANYLAARIAATHELWIVAEHVPHAGLAWLLANQRDVDELLAQVFAAIRELGGAGIVHFDAHLGNIVTDGTTWRLVDFGLAMADDFELTVAERAFLDRHRHYDFATVLLSLAQMLMTALGHRDHRRLGADIDAIDDAPVAYAPELRDTFRRYRAPMISMAEHFARMYRPSKRSRYDDVEMARMLRAAGVPT